MLHDPLIIPYNAGEEFNSRTSYPPPYARRIGREHETGRIQVEVSERYRWTVPSQVGDTDDSVTVTVRARRDPRISEYGIVKIYTISF